MENNNIKFNQEDFDRDWKKVKDEWEKFMHVYHPYINGFSLQNVGGFWQITVNTWGRNFREDLPNE